MLQSRHSLSNTGAQRILSDQAPELSTGGGIDERAQEAAAGIMLVPRSHVIFVYAMVEKRQSLSIAKSRTDAKAALSAKRVLAGTLKHT
jgi:hypothetical protein